MTKFLTLNKSFKFFNIELSAQIISITSFKDEFKDFVYNIAFINITLYLLTDYITRNGTMLRKALIILLNNKCIQRQFIHCNNDK